MPPKSKKQKTTPAAPLDVCVLDQTSQLATNLQELCHPLNSDEIQIMQQVLKAAYKAITLYNRPVVVTEPAPITLEATLQSILGCREIAESISSFLFAEPKAKDSHNRWGNMTSFPILTVCQTFNQSFRTCIGFLHLSMNRDRHNKFSKLLPTFPDAHSIVITRSGKLGAPKAIADLFDTLMTLARSGKREMRLIGFDRQELSFTQMMKFVQVLKMPSMQNLKTLDLHCMKFHPCKEIIEAIGSGLILTRLENLSLGSNAGYFGDFDMEKLIKAWEKSNGSKHIKQLDISTCGLTTRGINKLLTAIEAGLLPSLRVLHLGSLRYGARGRNTCSITDMLRLMNIAERGALTGLEELDIRRLTFFTEAMSAKFASVCDKGHFPNLKILKMTSYDFTTLEMRRGFETAMGSKLRLSPH